MLTVTLVLPGVAGGVDLRFDPGLGLSGVLGELVSAGSLPPQFGSVCWFRSRLMGHLVSAFEPLGQGGCVDGDVLVAVG